MDDLRLISGQPGSLIYKPYTQSRDDDIISCFHVLIIDFSNNLHLKTVVHGALWDMLCSDWLVIEQVTRPLT